MISQYDLVVIGAGSGGLVSAEVAAKLGAKVAMIEALPNLGGECLNAGCVPSKALIKAARTAYAAKNGARYGVTSTTKVDFSKVMAHVKGSIKTIEQARDNDENYIQMGVDVYHGKAQFINPKLIQVGQDQLKFKKCIIATGSRPLVPNIPGLNKTSYLTNETIFELTSLPKRLTAIGGGPISVELGQAFAMLGTEVTLLVREDRLLPREEPAASAVLQAEFERMGITLHFGVDLKSTSGSTGKIQVNYEKGGVAASIDSTHLLIAAGRVPNTDFSPESAGLVLTERGAIAVNQNLTTSQKHIFAVGDCNGGMQFTHTAAEQATIAVQNAFFLNLRKSGQQMPVWATFTTPEIAHLGAMEADLVKKNTPYKSHVFNYDEIDRAVAEGEDGYIQVLVSKNGELLGATIVGENAGEIISQLVLAAHHKLPFSNVGAVMQAYPTYGMGLKEMSSRIGFEKLIQSRIGRVIKQIL